MISLLKILSKNKLKIMAYDKQKIFEQAKEMIVKRNGTTKTT